MNYLFPIIIGSWLVGFIGYGFITHHKKYNNLIFYNVSDKVIRFKKVKSNTNIKSN